MFADPQSVTINAVAQSLPAVSREGKRSTYTKADGMYNLIISHSTTKNREKHLVRLEHRKTVSDPLIPANNVDVISSVHVVIENPITGFTDAELGYNVAGLLAWLNASTNTARVLGNES